MGNSLEPSLLLANFQQGDPRAFTAIYEEISPVLYLVSTRITLDSTISQEIIQDAFIALYRNRERLNYDRGIGGLRAYLIKTVRHESHRAVSKRNELDVKLRLLQDHLITTQDIVEDPDVFRAELIADIIARIKKEIADLSTTQQKIFDLHFVQELSIDEVAAYLNMPQQSIRNAKTIILTRLRMSELSLLSLLALIATTHPHLLGLLEQGAEVLQSY